MKTRAEEFAGLTVAMITPFKNGKIDFDTLQEQVEFLIEGGVSVLAPTGTTGESPTLTHEEQHEVIRKVVEFANGRVKVLAGTGSNNTEEALSLTRYAESVGADAALVITPYYNKPTQEGLYQHFKAIAEAVDIGICVYNVPGRTGRAIDPETVIRLANIRNITMVKEASGSMDGASKIIAATDLTVLSGDDSLTLPFMSLGAKGVVSVVGNFAPKELAALCAAMNRGDVEEARKIHYRIFPLCRDMLSLATNPIPVKKAMQLLGRDSGELRLPMTELDPALTERLQLSLTAFGL
ncbi:MAG: 4-hydroxy-tetrahydrodipicolinate synthase [Thermoguttaceae bacterium]